MLRSRDDLIALVRRLLDSAISCAERVALARQLRAEVGDDLLDRILRLDAPLPVEGLVDAILAARSARLRIPSAN